MHTDTHRKYAALQRVSGAVNEAKRKRFFRLLYFLIVPNINQHCCRYKGYKTKAGGG